MGRETKEREGRRRQKRKEEGEAGDEENDKISSILSSATSSFLKHNKILWNLHSNNYAVFLWHMYSF